MTWSKKSAGLSASGKEDLADEHTHAFQDRRVPGHLALKICSEIFHMKRLRLSDHAVVHALATRRPSLSSLGI